ncbi:alpha-galactosidase [Paraprevotella xylaniphila]|uniref:alpha-galactosidase n=1 Tax=Paraprevotella xylaniphila TaxID=454155 RepID=UPI0023F1594D|nr:hypothetical protein [Paraprevotella xylaniphila]
MKKRLDITLIKKMFLLSLWTVPVVSQADDIVVADGMWKITYMESEKAFRINVLNEGGAARKCVVNHSVSVARYDNAEGVAREVTTASFADVARAEEAVDNEFGAGKCYTFTFSRPDNGDEVTMKQRFYIYPGLDYMLTDLSVEGDAAIRSNYLAPVSVDANYTLYMSDDGNRMLKVPFDNDGFGRYGKYKMSGEVISYEVSALYEGKSREGLVLGSVDHNLWKSAVSANLSNNGSVNELRVYSGVSTSETRDAIPHGKVKGPVVTSARMFVGYFDDWRVGMETFADANNLVAPRTETWTYGTPFGWQSWGVLESKNSYATDVEISDYYHDVLTPAGFCNSQGNIIFSLDAGDGMSNVEHLNFINQCKKKNQMVGCYSTPFSMWSGENPNWDDVLGTASDGTKWTRWDVVLKANGKPIWYDGAYCMDPTHPYTKSAMANFIRTQYSYGFKYIKMDFVNCGIIQADSYYNPEVTTAVAAYSEGMDYIRRQMDKYGMFAAFSIAPLFPYQYANSRRIACDTWGSIEQTEFSMNAISGGWWTDRLFQYNDPDHLVLVGNKDQLNNTIGENRARYTNGAVTGMMLVADNFSLNDRSGQGWAERSREVAQTVMLNKDINEMADMGRSFRPVYGYKEYNGNADGAENFFMFDNDKYLYVAVFNYQKNELSGNIPLDLLDISSDAFSEVRELWTNELIKVDGNLPYSVPEKDVRVYRFKKTGGSGVKDMENEAMVRTKVVPLGGKRLMVYSGKDMNRIEVYDMQGRLNGTRDLSGRTQMELDLPHFNGMALVRIHYADGTKEVCKTLVY